MQTVVVLGAGLVGSTISLDLAANFKVTAVDLNEQTLAQLSKRSDRNIAVKVADFTNFAELSHIIAKHDLVVSAVPGKFGFEILKLIIECRKSCVDISFFPEDALALNALAEKLQVTAVVDCGLAPGLPNLVLGFHDRQMEVSRFEYRVGGLPLIKTWPFYYKAPFSPADVIEEYLRPARYRSNGQLVVAEAMSQAEFIDYPNVGTLEAVLTDGLRSLLTTMAHIPDMQEKTLRYPGHIDLIKALKQADFFSSEPLEVGKQTVIPLAVTSAILFEQWKLAPEEQEFSLLDISIWQNREENPALHYYLYDQFCPETGASSMARTTGYTANAVLNLLATKRIEKFGVLPPELIGHLPGVLDAVLAYLTERNVRLELVTAANGYND